MKKPFAIFTIAKDESVILPIWLKHYRNTFADEDIYVLDHQTKDKSTENIGVNVIPIFNPEAGRHTWLVEQAQEFQVKLLEKYDVVLYTDADEIIYTPDDKSLLDVLEEFRQSNHQYVNCVGYEIVHIMEEEAPLNLLLPIMEQRNKWSREPLYDKPLITKVPLKYDVGFHYAKYVNSGNNNNPNNYCYNLHLLHLHRMDYNIMLQRHIWKNTEWNLADEGGLGFHNRLYQEEEIKSLMINGYAGGIGVYDIPLEHKIKLNYL